MWRALRKVGLHAKWLESALKFLLKLYFIARFLLGKVDMPSFELVLTTKCTLHCAACANMMQYFSKDTHYTCTLDGIQASLAALFKSVDSVRTVRVLGGEPLLHKELPQVIRLLRESPKIKSFDIVTNGTIEFGEDVLDALEGTPKPVVSISDYRPTPNLKAPLHQDSIIARLKERKIPVSIHRNDEGKPLWHDPGKIYKRGRPKEEVIENFRLCMHGCVSMMTSEGAKDSSLAPLGAIFVCPVASSLSRLKGLAEFEGDFIGIAGARKERFLEFYAQDYFKACDYCHDMREERRYIPVAEQTKEIFDVDRAGNAPH